jgi:CBS domain-containing protein
MKAGEIMSSPVITVAPETGIKTAAGLLVQHAISALPVVDAKGELVGIVSEADLLPIETRPDPRSQAMPLPPTAGTAPQMVAEVMTRRVLTVPADCEVSEVARILLEADLRRVPVVTGGKLVGIISRRDVIKVIATRDDTIETEIARRLGQLGLGTSPEAIGVTAGVATIHLDEQRSNRRLAESVVLTVPGVLEVRFTNSKER